MAATRTRIVGRRLAVFLVVGLQAFFLVRAAGGSSHKEFAFRMFPEASTWRADVVRVTAEGRRVPVEQPWSGYSWPALVDSLGLAAPGVRHHATSGVANQLAYLDAALDWVARHTPRDRETRYLEARVTYWPNGRDPRQRTLRSVSR